MNLKRESVYVCTLNGWEICCSCCSCCQVFFDCFLLMLPIIRIFVLNNGMKWRVESFYVIDILEIFVSFFLWQPFCWAWQFMLMGSVSFF